MEIVNGIELTEDQIDTMRAVEALILDAIGEQCQGCSKADIDPQRLGMAAARGRVSQETTAQNAADFRLCKGLGQVGTINMCHYNYDTSAA